MARAKDSWTTTRRADWTGRSGQRLTAAFVRTAPVGRHGDGYGSNGLSLMVSRRTNGSLSRKWHQRLRTNGKVRMVSLGSYPEMSLREARIAAAANWEAAKAGRDLSLGTGDVTFQDATERVIAAGTWKAGSRIPANWRNSFKRYVYPMIGSKPVGSVTSGDIMAILEPIWGTTPEAAKVLKYRLGRVLKWARAQNLLTDDPMAAVHASLSAAKRKASTKVITVEMVREALAAVDVCSVTEPVRLAIHFMVLTACRSAEARGARWAEINLETATWTIPAERMKAGREHAVPLSGEAVAVLDIAAEKWGKDDLVFPSPVSGREISHSTISSLFRTIGAGIVPHDTRRSFRDFCAENNVSQELAEQALAHRTGGSVEMAYRRSQLVEPRREVMAAWARAVTESPG